MSSRVAGAEEIPLETHLHPIASKGSPPPYPSEAALLPNHNHSDSPFPKPVTTSRWHKYKRQPFPIILVSFLAIIIIIAVVLSQTVGRKKSASPTPGSPNDLSTAKIFGLAAAECEAATFVVWKVASGDFWWKGVLSNGEGEIPLQKVNQASIITNYTQPGFVDLTASCWNNGAESLEVIFQFIYYDPHVFHTFISTNIVINLPSGGLGSSLVPNIALATIREFDRKIEYNITSLGVAAVTPSPRTAKIRRNHLVYLVPRDLSKPDGPADVVYRPSIGSQWGWDDPHILDGTAMDAKASIAVASIDGGEYNSNATSVHVIFAGDDSRLMYLNWTESGNWSSAIPIYTNSGGHYQFSFQKFTLAIPSVSQNHGTNNTSLTRRQFTLPPPSAAQNNSINYHDPLSPGSIRLNLYWLSSSSASNSNPNLPIANVTTLSIVYNSTTNTMRTVGDYDLELGGSNDTTSLIAKPLAYPAYLAAAAYNPSILQNNYTQAGSGQIGNNRTAENTWSERVQLFFVETDEADSQGGKVANITFQKTDLGGNAAWSWGVGNVVVANIET